MELSNSNIKNFFIIQEVEAPKKLLIFSQKKAFLIFPETETPPKIFVFQETELAYISGNGNPKKLLIFQEVTFQARKIKKNQSEKTYISRKWNFLAPCLKNSCF